MHFHGPIIRPQTDADSLFIEVTAGCAHNACTFCNFYKDTPFFVAPIEQIREDLEEAKERLPRVKKIWASGGDPFVLAPKKQIEVWQLMKSYYPEAVISTYATISDFKGKTIEDIKAIKAAGLSGIMIGIESGDDEVLAHVNKGYTAADILDACHKMDEAGITYRMIYLGGLAGKGKLEESARRSAKIFNQIHPYYMILTNVAVLPGTKLYAEMMRGEWQEATEKERLQETRTLLSELKNPITVDSATATSSIYFVVDLPREREEILAKLDDLIENFSEEDERGLSARRHSMASV